MRGLENQNLTESKVSLTDMAVNDLVDLRREAPSTERRHSFGSNREADAMLQGFSLSDSLVAQLPPESTLKLAPSVKVEFGAISTEFRKVIDACVHSAPSKHLEDLAAKDYRVFAVRDVSDYEQKIGRKIANEHPEGYPPGWTWANVDCFFDPKRKRIVLFQNFVPHGQTASVRSFEAQNTPGRFRHEFGHALDEARGFALQTDPEMAKLYEQALKTLDKSPVTSKALAYYLPQADTDKSIGLRETIAGLYSIAHGGATDQPHVERALKSVFSDMLNYMAKKGY